MSDQPYQLLPPLTAEEYAALRDDIVANGIRVPVDVDEAGQLLDGHHRHAIAAELGVPCPTRIVAGLTEEDKRAHALAVNLQRRTLNREQRRALILAELEHDPSRSDRAIGRLIGADHKTIGAVRREVSGEIPHPQPDPLNREQAEALTRRIHDGLDRAVLDMVGVVDELLAKGATETTVMRVIGDMEYEAHKRAPAIFDDAEIRQAVHKALVDPVVVYLGARKAEFYRLSIATQDPGYARAADVFLGDVS